MGNESSQAAMDRTMWNMRYTSKQMAGESKKCEKKQREEESKCLKAQAAGNTDIARVYASNAIREKTQAINLLRMSARIEAVAARVETAIRMKQVRAQSRTWLRLRPGALELSANVRTHPPRATLTCRRAALAADVVYYQRHRWHGFNLGLDGRREGALLAAHSINREACEFERGARTTRVRRAAASLLITRPLYADCQRDGQVREPV